MKAVILAGGLGTRLSEETEVRPKPMVDLGGRPLIWHIMKHYASFGFNDFAVALGYKGEDIKEFFLDYRALSGSITISLKDGDVQEHSRDRDDWIVDLIDTGFDTQTGGRVRRLAPWLNGETFMLTYGDGLSNVAIDKLIDFHRSHGKLATITAVRPPARFGGLEFKDDGSVSFTEKPQIGEGWINGGFMVLEQGVLDYLTDDQSVLERDGLERLSEDGQLMAYKHEDFWQCIDTLRDLRSMRAMWDSGDRPWLPKG